MKRFLLGVAAFTAAVTLASEPARAQVGTAPWCAVINIGKGSVYWDCRYRTVEDCVPNVLAGNRGFCNMNPRWEGWYRSEPGTRQASKRRHRRPAND